MMKWTIRLLKLGLLVAAWIFLGWIFAALVVVLLLAAAVPTIDVWGSNIE